MTDLHLRDPRMYAEFGGRSYPAFSTADPSSRTKMMVILTAVDGSSPFGFEVPAGQTLPRRDVPQSEVDRLYRVRITCMYRGGGPFDVLRLDRRPDGTWLKLLYTGGDRDWALAQPRVESIEGRRVNREPDVEGWIPFSEAEFVQEFEDELIRPRRGHKPVA